MSEFPTLQVPPAQRKEIFVFDASLPNLGTLTDAAATGYRIIVLDPAQAALTHLAAALAGESGIDAIHIISHGSAGSLLLGNTLIDGSSLDSHAVQLAEIGAHLSAGGDILLYGCALVSDTAGSDFARRFAALAGADVAASTDLTGSAAAGGNWVLEWNVGAIETAAIAPGAYGGVLIAESEVNNTRAAANSLALASTVTASLATAADVDYFSVTAAAAGILSLTFNPPVSAGEGYYAVRIEDALGTSLASFVNAAGSATFQLGVAQAGTYHVRVGISNQYNHYSNPSSYSLTANFAAGSTAGYETESNDTRATADVASLGGAMTGDLSVRADVDYYSVALTSSGVVGLTFARPADRYPGYYRISVEDGAGTRLASFTDSNGPFNMLTGLGTAGTYFVRVENTDRNGMLDQGQYSIAFALAAASATGYETEPNSARQTADHLDLGVAIVGQFSSVQDIDWYEISVSATGLLTLHFDRPNVFYGGYFTIRLEDATGLVIAGFADYFDPQSLTIALATAGTYYARVSSTYEGTSFYDNLYSLRATHVASSIAGYETESNDTRGTAIAGTLQTAMHGQLSSRADTDYFSFSVPSAGVLAIDFMRPAQGFPNFFDFGYATLTVESSTGKNLGSFFTEAAPQVMEVFVPAAGTYYAKLTSHGSYPKSYNGNPYTLTATHTPSRPDSQQVEPNDTFQTAMPMTGGVQVLDQFHSLTDIDYFSITTAGAGTIVVAFDRPDTGPSTFFNLRIENSAGALLAGGTIQTDVQTFQVATGEADTYYIRLNNIANQGNLYNANHYGLTATLVPDNGSGLEDEPNNTPAQADAITQGIPVFGSLGSATDKDYFSFTVAAAGLASLSFNRPAGIADAFEIGIEDASGRTLAAFPDRDDPQTWTVALMQAGTYYARITNHAPYFQPRDQYSLTLGFSAGSTAGYELESNGTRAQSTPLLLGSPISGQIASPTDLDYYVVTATSAGMLNLSLTPGAPSFYDTPTLAVEDSDGNTLASFNNNYSKATSLSLALADPGTYHIRVSNTAVNGVIPVGQALYGLQANLTAGVATGVETESNNTRATADQIAIGGPSMAGQLFGVSDVDYYRFTASQSGLLTVLFVMPATGNGLIDVGVVNDAGTLLVSRFSLFAVQEVKVMLPEAGIYHVRVSSHDPATFPDGQYSFTTSFNTTPVEVYELEDNNTPSTANTLQPGATVKGQIALIADADHYALAMDSSGFITLNFATGALGYGASWSVTLTDSAGMTRGAFASHGDALSATFGVAAPGNYFAVVRANPFSTFGYDMPYTLSTGFAVATAGLDEIRGTAGNDALTGSAAADKILGGNGGDVLRGGGGNDTLDGGAESDFLSGETGDDTYLVDQQYDQVTEAPSEGFDTIHTTLGVWTLGANVEALVYNGVAAFTGYGNTENNTLVGAIGNDTLDGAQGADFLAAGAGNDTYVVDNQGDVVSEGFAAGVDTVLSSIDLVLPANVENPSLKDQVGLHLAGTGNALDNTIIGNGSDNLLVGAAGNDQLLGGNGVDSLHGGDGDDTLEGGAGDDTLDGGAGFNVLQGGDGNDTYMISTRDFDLFDSGGNDDTAIVSTNFVKLPSTIEHVIYVNAAQPLPYWIDALLPDDAAGGRYTALLGTGKTFGYTFPTTLPAYNTDDADAFGYSAFNAAQKAFARLALDYISSVIDVSYIEVGNAAAGNTIAFGNNAQQFSAAYAYHPSDSYYGSDVFLDNLTPENLAPADGTYEALTLIHELGHTLGLEHPFPGDSDAPFLNGSEDDTVWTVMSYNDRPAQYHLAYSPLDIAALQYLYGPSSTARSGNNNHVVSATGAHFIWDGAGIDAIDASAQSLPATLYLEPGLWGFVGAKSSSITANGQVTVNFGSAIENLRGGSGDDRLWGNGLANDVMGNAGNDMLDGGLGNDSLDGGIGNDQLSGGLNFDLLVGGDGNDTLRGGEQADTLLGGEGNDLLIGGKGTDSLDGGIGNDTLTGGLGTDLLIGGDGIDTADYSGSTDGVTVSLLLTTAQQVSVATGLDTLLQIENLIGSALHDNLTGSTANNTLVGGQGNDTLSGDTGFDLLDGGEGNDSLAGGLNGDTLLGGSGNDFLGGGQGIDSLVGGDGDDTLVGGLGADLLIGGTGADRFVFRQALDGTNNIDTIADLESGVDVVELSASIFTALAPMLGSRVGVNAHLVYDSGTGVLSYDADGPGGLAPLPFAILGTNAHPAGLGLDFLVVA